MASNLLRLFSVVVFGMALHALGDPSGANDSRLISSSEARQHGLEVQWFSQIQIAAAYGRIHEMVLQVNENEATTMFEMTYGDNREIISEHDLNAEGQERGVDGAEEWANLRKEVLQLRGFEPKIQKLVRPRATLYAVTSRSIVQSIDAETGKTNWTTSVGDPRYPTSGIAANNDFVCVVNGSSVYCLESGTGNELWRQRCESSPMGGVAISGEFVFVTQVTGRVEAFPLNDLGIPKRQFVSFGRALARPLVTDISVSWPTDRGFYNVASCNDPKAIVYMLEADNEIVCEGVASGDQLIVASRDGKTYALQETTGRLNWEFSLGDPISQSPVSLGNSVYVITDIKRLYKLDSRTGSYDDKWPTGISGITNFVAASESQIYFADDLDQLIAFDRENGNQTMSLSMGTDQIVFPNQQSDRIYIGTPDGAIQCLREQANYHPYFHADASETGVADAEEAGDADSSPDTEEPAEPEDPFAPGQPADSDNPFGNPAGGQGGDNGDAGSGDEDPFSGSGDSDDEDPFGG